DAGRRAGKDRPLRHGVEVGGETLAVCVCLVGGGVGNGRCSHNAARGSGVHAGGIRDRVPELVVPDGAEGDPARGGPTAGSRGGHCVQQRLAVTVKELASDAAAGAPVHLQAIPVVRQVAARRLAGGADVGEPIAAVVLDEELARVGRQHHRQRAAGGGAEAEVGPAVGGTVQLHPDGDRVPFLHLGRRVIAVDPVVAVVVIQTRVAVVCGEEPDDGGRRSPYRRIPAQVAALEVLD